MHIDYSTGGKRVYDGTYLKYGEMKIGQFFSGSLKRFALSVNGKSVTGSMWALHCYISVDLTCIGRFLATEQL